MNVIVRKSDGYIVNTNEINKEVSNEYDNLYNILDLNYYDLLDIDIPEFENIEFLNKQYYYIDGNVTCKYCETPDLEVALKKAEEELASTDYIFVKAQEARTLNTEISDQYDYVTLAEDRQKLRDKINNLRTLHREHPYVSPFINETLIYK